jgi:hypothetical protein
MARDKEIIERRVELYAREEKHPPKGVEPQADRDIGFATVVLRLDNPYQETISLTIHKIEIRNVSDHRVQPFNYSPQEILLAPLENGEFAFQSTNKTGYVGRDLVEAVVTYRVGNRTKVVVSEPVEIDRH